MLIMVSLYRGLYSITRIYGESEELDDIGRNSVPSQRYTAVETKGRKAYIEHIDAIKMRSSKEWQTCFRPRSLP